LQYQHKSLVDLVDGLTDEQVRRTVIPGKWSIFENIVHLQTYQHVFCARLKKIILGGQPVFERYTADSDPAFLDNCERSTREIMQDLLSLRKEMASGIPQLSESQIEQTGLHPVYGKMNVVQWLNFFLLHEAHHMFTILKLAGELRKVSTKI